MTTEAAVADANKHATAFLDYYCDDATRADYAVLIDGPWGSGKTRFIVEYLKKHNTAIQRHDPLQPNAIYVSLFGLTKPEEVRSALFAAAHRYLTAAPSRFFGIVVGGVLEQFTGVKNLKPDDYIKIDASVIVFDDLERTSIPPADVLGIVNGFIDSARGRPFKVIVVANQDEIDQPEEYTRQREKVIGRTLKIEPDARAAAASFIDKIHDPRARGQAQQSQDLILRYFEAWRRGNLRSLRHALADFDRLVSAAGDVIADKPRALEALLSLSIALGLEVRSPGGLPSSDEYGSLPLLQLGRLDEDGSERARDIIERYPEVNWRDPILPQNHIGDLATSGRLDVDEIRERLTRHPLVAGPAGVAAWRQLYAWETLSLDEYPHACRRFRDELKDGLYKNPAEILHAAGVAISLQNGGDRLFADVVAVFTAYIDGRAEGGDLVADLRAVDPDDEVADGLPYLQRDSDEYQKIARHLRGAVATAHKTAMQALAQRVLASAQAGQSIDAELLGDVDLEGGYDAIAFLHHIDPAAFAKVLLRDGRQLDSALMTTLGRRYRGAAHYPELLTESAWVDAVAEEAAKIAAAAPPPFAESWSAELERGFRSMKRSLASA